MPPKPAALSDSTPGLGEIEARKFMNSTSVSTLSFAYPLRLIPLPSRPPVHAALIFTLTYGGGLVAGDGIDLHVKVRQDARLTLLTQGSTKIYKSPSKDIRATQGLTANIEPGAALVLLQDPIQPFKGSTYEQLQVFHIDPMYSNLLLLDWVCEGRTALGEAWDFWEWKSRNEIWSGTGQTNEEDSHQEPKLLIRDNIRLGSNAILGEDPREEMYNLGVFGTLFIRGPMFRTIGKAFLDEFSHLPRIGTNTQKFAQSQSPRPAQLPKGKPQVTWTAASIRGFVVVKFGAREVDEVKVWLNGILSKEGTIEREFGEHAMMCLRI